jgi:hypothetical protein
MAPPAARYYGEVPQRGAKRTGGFRGVVPPGQHRPRAGTHPAQ